MINCNSGEMMPEAIAGGVVVLVASV